MKKIVLTEEVTQALTQLWNWARCEVSTSAALPTWQIILKAVVDETVDVKEEK